MRFPEGVDVDDVMEGRVTPTWVFGGMMDDSLGYEELVQMAEETERRLSQFSRQVDQDAETSESEGPASEPIKSANATDEEGRMASMIEEKLARIAEEEPRTPLPGRGSFDSSGLSKIQSPVSRLIPATLGNKNASTTTGRKPSARFARDTAALEMEFEEMMNLIEDGDDPEANFQSWTQGDDDFADLAEDSADVRQMKSATDNIAEDTLPRPDSAPQLAPAVAKDSENRLIPLTERGPNTAVWKNKTLADELSWSTWGRPAAERPPRSPFPAFEGDVTIEELMAKSVEDKQRFMREAEKHKDDDVAFTNFMRKQYNLAPIVEREKQNLTLIAETEQEMLEVESRGDYYEWLELEKDLNGLKYQEDPTWNQEEEDFKWAEKEYRKLHGMHFDTAEEFVEHIESTVDDWDAKMARIGEFWDDDTGDYILREIPFEVCEDAQFDTQLIGPGLELSADKKTVCKKQPGPPTYALWGMSATDEVCKWKVKCESTCGLLCVGVMEIPFAPTEGYATRLATPAWFITSSGLACRNGPSQAPGRYQFMDKENMTFFDNQTNLWQEGFTVNPKYRRRGCSMHVDTETGEVCWLEEDVLTFESAMYGSGIPAYTRFGEELATEVQNKFGEKRVQAAARRAYEINRTRYSPSRDNFWFGETWEQAYNRSLQNGLYEKLLKKYPDPDHEELTDDALFEDIMQKLDEAAEKMVQEGALSREFVSPQKELYRHECLADLDILKFGEECFHELETDGQPSVVRLEHNKRDKTLIVRIDNRPEAFLFENVSSSARPFVNIFATRNELSLID